MEEPVVPLRRKKIGNEPSVPPVATRRDAMAPNAPRAPFADVGPVLTALRAAQTRDAVTASLLTGMRTVARRVGVLAVRKDEIVGWACTPELCDPAAFRNVKVPSNLPSVLSSALHESGAHLVRVARTAAHESLVAAIGTTTAESAAVAVRVEGRAALVVLADELGDTMIATKRMEELARAAGDALARLVRDKKK
jgi:hypothetical protein